MDAQNFNFAQNFAFNLAFLDDENFLTRDIFQQEKV